MAINSTNELAGHDREIEDRIFRKYYELRIKNKNVCDECSVCASTVGLQIENEGRPVSFFVVGDGFRNEKFRIMFVGKTVQTEWGEHATPPDPIDRVSGFIDARKNSRKLLFLPYWSTQPFWQCIKEICQELWGESIFPDDIWRRIAITNLVKCSTSKGLDETPYRLKINCIQRARFFESEVKIVEPTHLVLFVGPEYDQFLDTMDFGCKPIDIGVHKREWWERKFSETDRMKMRLIRGYHPGYFRLKGASEKERFCKHIADWVKATSISS